MNKNVSYIAFFLLFMTENAPAAGFIRSLSHLTRYMHQAKHLQQLIILPLQHHGNYTRRNTYTRHSFSQPNSSS